MQYHQLGSAPIKVSEICLGSMTWGIQNTQQDADEQIAYALANGINFIDCAEMYPVPPNADTYGDTERIIGNWLARHPEKRKDLIIASKIAGSGLKYIRQGSPISGATVALALEDSLKRLQTDVIDLYQLHWPNRFTPHFSKHWPGMISFTKQDAEKQTAQMLDILTALDNAIKAGKIRYWGLSDDTPWGISQYVRLAEQHGLAKPVSIQNEFSLLHAKDWPYLIENCVYENIAYLPWSPLAGGALSGKYLDGARPEGTRWTLVQRQGLFRDTDISNDAVRRYVQLASEFDMSPTTLALAWCRQVDGVTSTIIGATSMAQLEENIAAFSVRLTDEQLKAITEVLKQYPMPF
ncbi:aldo/keto reductase [Aestuariibacter salexigens]|uniref:aldo/keto reductase n=1 Tax=Aestuariibacter salexigens TaxID=226010 RepID=UPI0004097CEA|nr:aldo/keto reductase [Aestuariibacter salexigens]